MTYRINELIEMFQLSEATFTSVTLQDYFNWMLEL